MPRKSNELRAQATKRLILAVVNQAISDVLENGKEAKEAEQWLLSADFDVLDSLFARSAKATRTCDTESAKRPILINKASRGLCMQQAITNLESRFRKNRKSALADGYVSTPYFRVAGQLKITE